MLPIYTDVVVAVLWPEITSSIRVQNILILGIMYLDYPRAYRPC